MDNKKLNPPPLNCYIFVFIVVEKPISLPAAKMTVAGGDGMDSGDDEGLWEQSDFFK